MRQHQRGGGDDDGEPHEDADDAEHRPDDRHEVFEEPIEVPQRNAWEHDVHQTSLRLVHHHLFVTTKQDGRVRRDVRFDQVRAVKLREDLDDFRLRGRVIGELSADEVPRVADRAMPVEQADELVGGIREAVILIAGGIADHVPTLAAIELAADLRAGAELGLETLDAVPRLRKRRAKLQSHWRSPSGPLSPVPGGEGWGEGVVPRPTQASSIARNTLFR